MLTSGLLPVCLNIATIRNLPLGKLFSDVSECATGLKTIVLLYWNQKILGWKSNENYEHSGANE